MKGKCILSVRMELLSDTIFGSGFSIPGGADLSTRQNDEGFPWISGSTFKGLLRESLENLLFWSGKEAELAKTLFGADGWAGLESSRRVQVTALVLENPPSDPTDCYQERTFTALEQGVVKTGSLRTAHCVMKGLCFIGQLVCAAEDCELLEQAVQGIQFVGTQRSRGLGHVRCRIAERKELELFAAQLSPAHVIRYRLKNQLPVIITDLGHSFANGYAAQNHIPGSAVRGMVLNALAERDPVWFEGNKQKLLSEDVRFLSAIPCPEHWEPLPPIMGFYGPKSSDQVVSVLEEDVAGMKRAGLGTCCQIVGDTIQSWNAAIGGTMRIARQTKKRKDALPFQVHYLEAGQNFTGYILLRDPDLAPMISSALTDIVWIGADRHSGFGQCQVLERIPMEQPMWMQYGYRAEDAIGQDLYLLALSPLGLIDEWGEPCGLQTELLKEKLGVDVQITACSTSLQEFGGFNRTWQCRLQHQRMYDRGSIFKLHCAEPPSREALERLQREGLGQRKAEGFGQLLFLRPELLRRICRKQMIEAEVSDAVRENAALRRAKYQWLMAHYDEVNRWKMSSSQLGTLQSFCQQGDVKKLQEHLEHNLNNRGANHGARYREVDRFVKELLEQQVMDLGTEHLSVRMDDREKLQLLTTLIDHSRKEKRGIKS